MRRQRLLVGWEKLSRDPCTVSIHLGAASSSDHLRMELGGRAVGSTVAFVWYQEPGMRTGWARGLAESEWFQHSGLEFGVW